MPKPEILSLFVKDYEIIHDGDRKTIDISGVIRGENKVTEVDVKVNSGTYRYAYVERRIRS